MERRENLVFVLVHSIEQKDEKGGYLHSIESGTSSPMRNSIRGRKYG